jgi:hypothetical protein
MATIAHTTDRHNPRLHRRAMRHNTTPAQQARYIAESVALKLDEGRPVTFADYGIGDNAAMQELVIVALATLRGTN